MVGNFHLPKENILQQTLTNPLGKFDKRFSQRLSTILALAHDALTEPPSPIPAYLCSRADRWVQI